MTERQLNERASADQAERRPWTRPTLDVIPIADDTEGPSSGFPHTDSVTGIS